MEENYSAYPPAAQEGTQVNMLELGRLLLSKWYLLVAVGILAAAVAFCAGYFFVSPRYETSITINVDNARVENSSGNASSSDVSAARSLAETYCILLSSNSVMEEMVHRLSEQGVSVTEKGLSSCIRVKVLGNTQILQVLVETEDRELSYRIASVYEQVAPEMIVKLSNRGHIYIVDHARKVEKTSYPDLVQTTISAFVFGIMLCAGVLLLRKFVDRRVYVAEDVERELNLSVIGEIPMGNADAEPSEQYRAVRIGERQNENK